MQSVTDPPPFGPCEDNVEERLPLLFFHLQTISRSSAVHFLPSLFVSLRTNIEKDWETTPCQTGEGVGGGVV